VKVLVIALALLAGCASVAKLEGERTVGERMTITLDGAWNQVNAPGVGPADLWTLEGVPVDRLLIYAGVKDGQPVHTQTGGTQKHITFSSRMQPEQIVAMFEGMFTRDGSRFRLTRLEPSSFAGNGFRFEYALTRSADDLQLAGVGYAAVSNGELFALLYQAPRIEFFPRHRARVEAMARTVKLKD